MSDKARSYVQVCERRTATVALELHTAEDHFNYGVERLNARDVDRARHHLGCALLLDPRADYILYTMALCCGLAGDGDGAYENLKLAIEVEPRNRILARQDPEFAALVLQLPVLRPLLSAEPSV
jgi:tetratricopeptide (TPR) repeat protein